MKTKIFALFLGMLCLLTNALAQSETLTGFNGRIKFTSFANNGLYVRGTLDDFLDQTNQYVASDIDSADVVWDNQGRRYLVHDVISSNLTQAVVDLSRIGGGSHIPTGVGFVSRETSNGLTLIPAANSQGISTQLLGRILTHNMQVLNDAFKNIGNTDLTIPPGERFLYLNSPTATYGGYMYFRIDTTNRLFEMSPYLMAEGVNVTNYQWAYGKTISNTRYYGGFGTDTYNGFGAGYPQSRIYSTKYHNSTYNTTIGEFTAHASTNNESKAMFQALGDSVTNSTGVLMSVMGVGYNNVHYAAIVRGEIYAAQATSSGSNSPNNRYFYNDSNINFHIQTSNTVGVGGKYNWISVKDLDNSTPNRSAISFYNDSYSFANYVPSAMPGAISTHIWTAGSASFLRSQHKTISGTTDGSGDISITFDASMPDATYTVIITGHGSTPYVYMTQSATLAQGSVKVRMFTLAGSAATSTAYQISYEVKNTN